MKESIANAFTSLRGKASMKSGSRSSRGGGARDDRSSSNAMDVIESSFQVEKHSWRGRYWRVLQLKRNTVVTVDPATWQPTNEFPMRMITSVKAVKDPKLGSNVFSISIRGKGDMKFTCRYRANLMSDFQRLRNLHPVDQQTQFGTANSFEAKRIPVFPVPRAQTPVACRLTADATSLVQSQLLNDARSGSTVVKTYPYCNIQAVYTHLRPGDWPEVPDALVSDSMLLLLSDNSAFVFWVGSQKAMLVKHLIEHAGECGVQILTPEQVPFPLDSTTAPTLTERRPTRSSGGGASPRSRTD